MRPGYMLSTRDLTHVYPNGTRALDRVTLDIPAGMFGLPGPNGGGHTVDALLRQVNLWDVRKQAIAGFPAACASASASRRR